MDDRPQIRSRILAASIAASWGPVHLAASPSGVVAVALTSTAVAFEADLVRRLRQVVRWVSLAKRGAGNDARALRHLRAAAAAIEADEGEREPTAGRAIDVVFDLTDRPAWDQAVLAAVRAIPRGEVRSYGQIARAVDRPGAARAVGGAVGRNPVAMLVPCHRVVAGDGTLGGYGGGWWGDHERLLNLKAQLLAREGVELPRSRSRVRSGG